MACRPSHEKGTLRCAAAAVELAFLLPFLCFLFVITLDYGRVFYFSQVVTTCARNGAIYLSDPANTTMSRYSDPTVYAVDGAPYKAAALAEAHDMNMNPMPTIDDPPVYGVDANSNPYVEVTARYTFNTLTHYPGVPSTVDLSRTVRMAVAPASPDP